MRVEKLQFDDVRYNPELGAFEAVVHIDDHGHRYAYPARMMAPLTAGFAHVARGLTASALAAHRHAALREMRLRRAPVPAAAPQPEPPEADRPQLRRLGGTLAA